MLPVLRLRHLDVAVRSPFILIDGGTMTEPLVEKTCTPCRGGIPPLTRQEAEALLVQAPDWLLVDEAQRIERTFRLKNFREALSFVQQVGELAEGEAHHPDISFGWGYATVSLRTKKIKGLHENDFIMAAKINRLAAAAQTAT
jgi:4a-hydroxytetrahydrobiopterin dehydratase